MEFIICKIDHKIWGKVFYYTRYFKGSNITKRLYTCMYIRFAKPTVYFDEYPSHKCERLLMYQPTKTIIFSVELNL